MVKGVVTLTHTGHEQSTSINYRLGHSWKGFVVLKGTRVMSSTEATSSRINLRHPGMVADGCHLHAPQKRWVRTGSWKMPEATQRLSWFLGKNGHFLSGFTMFGYPDVLFVQPSPCTLLGSPAVLPRRDSLRIFWAKIGAILDSASYCEVLWNVLDM